MTGRNMKAAVKMVTRGITQADGSVLIEEAHTPKRVLNASHWRNTKHDSTAPTVAHQQCNPPW
jgi:hypothetical protein